MIIVTVLGKSSASSSVSGGVGGGGVGAGGHVGVMGQYIMSQPFYQQPLPYGYEEVQMLQQRLPHHMVIIFLVTRPKAKQCTLQSRFHSLHLNYGSVQLS